MTTAVDRRDAKGVGETVEGERTGKAHNMPTVNDAAPKPAVFFEVLIEVNSGRILVQTGRQHVLCFFNRDAVNVVDSFADRIVFP